MKKIIKNGLVVSDSAVYQASILIENEKILSIGADFPETEAEIIDASGKFVIPGAVDVHTHMDLAVGNSRAVDDFFDGTVAAACGGTTSIVDHLAFGPDGCPLRHQIDEYHRLAAGKAVVDYGFHGVIQHVDANILQEMEELAQEGYTSFKVYLTYDNMLQDPDLFRVLQRAAELGIVIPVHCENNGVVNVLRAQMKEKGCLSPRFHPLSRPDRCEAEAVSRLLYLASMAGDAPVYVVHLSTEKGLQEIESAREAGQKNIMVETCPQYLVFTDEKYQDDSEGLKYIMSPPLRKKSDCEALWKGISNGQIQIVATDHCPFNFGKEKQLGANDFTACPNGAPGVEERLRVILSEGVMKGRITINKMVEILCTNPAKAYGLYPQKGAILPGADADIVILDPEKERILTQKDMHSAVDYTCYEGMKVRGEIDLVMQRGEVIVKENQFLGKRGRGKFLPRKRSLLIHP